MRHRHRHVQPARRHSIQAGTAWIVLGTLLGGCQVPTNQTSLPSKSERPFNLKKRVPPAGFVRGKLAGADLRKGWLVDVEVVGEDLSKARLTGAQLARARMDEVNLTGADLSGANMVAVKLRKAKLLGAKAVRTVMSDGDLSGSDLSGADLSDAVLLGTNLTGARLTGTRLKGATYSKSTRWPIGFDPAKAGAVKPNMPM